MRTRKLVQSCIENIGDATGFIFFLRRHFPADAVDFEQLAFFLVEYNGCGSFGLSRFDGCWDRAFFTGAATTGSELTGVLWLTTWVI